MGFKLIILVFVLFGGALIKSAFTPFIYTNEYMLTVSISYFILAAWFSSYVIYENKIDKNFRDEIRNKKFIIYFGYFISPLILGSLLSSSTPLVVDLFAFKLQSRELILVNTKEQSRYGSLSRVYVLDKNNSEQHFTIKTNLLNQLNLHAGDKFVVRGRNCIAGFVIDNINGIERK